MLWRTRHHRGGKIVTGSEEGATTGTHSLPGLPRPIIPEIVQVVGVPDPKYGEELAAAIIIKPGHALSEDDVRAFCRETLAHYKVPRYVRFIDAFPLTVTGKVQKYLLREQITSELQLSD